MIDPQLAPSFTVHVTARVVDPVTAAAKVCEPPAGTVAVAGSTATVTCATAPFFTRTTLAPLAFEETALAARTWYVPSVWGAV